MTGTRKAANYWDYLSLDRLLSIQGGVEGDESRLETDELHFIVVHQAFELWFKLILRELRVGRDHLSVPRVPEENIPYVVHHLRRVNEILKLMVDQFRVMETLTPQDFLAFRDKLSTASGFQSFQMREVEMVLGLEDSVRHAYGIGDPLEQIRRIVDSNPSWQWVWDRIAAAKNETPLRAALLDWLFRTPIQGSTPDSPTDERAVELFLRDYLAAVSRHNDEQAAEMESSSGGNAVEIRNRFAQSTQGAQDFLFAEDVLPEHRHKMRRVRAALVFIESYRDLPLLAWPRLLIDTVVELEEQLVLWRTRHARMVERTIGRRIGTGGSSGVDYLDRTAGYRIFGELWAVRTLLLARPLLPALEHPEAYGFAR